MDWYFSDLQNNWVTQKLSKWFLSNQNIRNWVQISSFQIWLDPSYHLSNSKAWPSNICNFINCLCNSPYFLLSLPEISGLIQFSLIDSNFIHFELFAFETNFLPLSLIFLFKFHKSLYSCPISIDSSFFYLFSFYFLKAWDHMKYANFLIFFCLI